MVSTHMSYGFVFAYFLSLLFAHIIFPYNLIEISSFNVYYAVFGLFGGIFPDILIG